MSCVHGYLPPLPVRLLEEVDKVEWLRLLHEYEVDI